MNNIRRHLAVSFGSLSLFTGLHLLLEVPALLFVYRGQILPPYGFYPNQLYDFLAKIRHALGDSASWLPALPDHFREPGLSSHLAMVPELAAAVIATGALLALVVGLLIALLRPNAGSLFGSYLWAWAVLAIGVHAADYIVGLSLDVAPTFEHIQYRARSFIVDGTVLSVLVTIGAFIAARSACGWLGAAERIRFWMLGGAVTFALALALRAVGVTHAPASAELTPLVEGNKSGLNVLLISLDSLRSDHLSCYGYERETTPVIDKIASEGARFENAISTSSWTLPTHLTMFTGRYQISHGVTEDTRTLSGAVPTAPELFKQAGYATAGFVSAPYTAPVYGYSRGMDAYVDVSDQYEHRKAARSAVVAPEVTDMGIEWLRENSAGKWFLFLHYFDTHYDYTAPEPFSSMFDPHYHGPIDGNEFISNDAINRKMDKRDLEHILALYDGEIRFTDFQIGRVIAELKRLGIYDRTLIVITSDHGDEFFEHHNKGHHRSLYDEVLKVPFVVRHPKMKQSAGKVLQGQVSLVDVLPTMLEGAGLAGPPILEGRSLLPVIDGAQPDDLSRAVYGELFNKRGFNLLTARRTPAHKTVQHFNRIFHPYRAPVEFYDLAEDPLEQKDLYGHDEQRMLRELSEMARWLEARWRIHRATEGGAAGSSARDMDDETLERLKSLGYLEG